MAAEQFRCKQWVVSESGSGAESLKKFGELTIRTSTTQDVLVPNANVYHNRELRSQVHTLLLLPMPMMIVTIADGEVHNMPHRSQQVAADFQRRR
jgi:hypothetical protein